MKIKTISQQMFGDINKKLNSVRAEMNDDIRKKCFEKRFSKIVYGHIEVQAANKKQAEEKFDNGDYEEFDNKSDYEFEEWEEK